jgi:hypothetical protein
VVVEESRELGIGYQNDVAAAPAIAAVGATSGYIFLAPERHAARPAVAGSYMDDRLIDQHR